MDKPSTTFSYVKYDEESTRAQESFKDMFQDIETFALQNLAPSRERSLLMTHLEIAYMWTGKAIRNDQILRNPAASDHVPERTTE